MKYLFIDTNNFMACALLTELDHTPQTIGHLIDLLRKDQAKLILPEIVEIEFFREVELELLKKKKSIESFKSLLGSIFPTHLMPDKAQFIKYVRQIYSKINASSQAAKANIELLFNLNSVIKIPLSYEIFIRAYRRALSRQKPSKSTYCPECGEIKHRFDDDCMVFESILSMKDELENNELIFCSANKKHFALHNKKQDKHFLHPDLAASFSQKTEVRYYIKLADALKAEFKKDINREEKAKINKYFEIQQKAFQLNDLMAQLRDEANLIASSPLHGIAKQAAESSAGIAEMLKRTTEGSLTEMFRRSRIDPIGDAIRAATTASWLIGQRQIADDLSKLIIGWGESVKKIAITGSKKNEGKNKKK